MIKNDSGLVKENGILGTNSRFLLKWLVVILGILIVLSKKKLYFITVKTLNISTV